MNTLLVFDQTTISAWKINLKTKILRDPMSLKPNVLFVVKKCFMKNRLHTKIPDTSPSIWVSLKWSPPPPSPRPTLNRSKHNIINYTCSRHETILITTHSRAFTYIRYYNTQTKMASFNSAVVKFNIRSYLYAINILYIEHESMAGFPYNYFTMENIKMEYLNA